MRIVQPCGTRGSLKWIQEAVNEHWPSLNDPIRQRLGGDRHLEWRSPLVADDYAEYRDSAFLELLGVAHLAQELNSFWPVRGPQWDALARSDGGELILVEAKSHVGEMCSPPSAASDRSLAKIEASLEAAAQAIGASAARAPWTRFFYQLANRISHLYWLRSQGERAWLVLVNFLNDQEMGGPSAPEVWRAAYDVAFHVLGLPKRHSLSPFIIEVFPDVRQGRTLLTPGRGKASHSTS